MANLSNTYFEVDGSKSKVNEFKKRFKKGLEGDYWYDNSVDNINYSLECVYIDEIDTFMSVSGIGKWSGPYNLIMKWAKEIGKGLKVHYIDYEEGCNFYVEFEVENGVVTMERSTTYYSEDFFKWSSESDLDITGEMEYISDDYLQLIHNPKIIWNMKSVGMWDEFVKQYLDKDDPEFIEVMKAFSILEENKEVLLKLCNDIHNSEKTKKVDEVIGNLFKGKLDCSKINVDEVDFRMEATGFVYNLCKKNKKEQL